MINPFDFFIAFGILAIVFGSRFNSWTEQKESYLSGKPSEYIGNRRFMAYRFMYIVCAWTACMALYMAADIIPKIDFPEGFSAWTKMLDAFRESNSLIMTALLLCTLVSESHISYHEGKFRALIQSHARIPKQVNELVRQLKDARYTPPEEVATVLKRLKELQGCNPEQIEKWRPIFERYEQEREKQSIYWNFIKACCMYTDCKHNAYDFSKKHEDDIEMQITKLSTLILSYPENQETSDETKELCQRLTIHICKGVVKKHPKLGAQLSELEKLGFNVGKKPPNKVDSIFFYYVGCMAAIVISYFVGVDLKLKLMDSFDLGKYSEYDASILVLWALGGALCSALAFFIAISIKRMYFEDKTTSYLGYVFTFLLSLLFANLYFFIDLNFEKQNPGWSYGKGFLAISFSLIGLVVLNALESKALNQQTILKSAFKYGINLGLAMAITLTLASIAFGWSRIKDELELFNLFFIKDHYFLYDFGIGFLRGLLLGFSICLILKLGRRKQYLQSQRKDRRIHCTIPLSVSCSSLPSTQALSIDITEKGAAIALSGGAEHTPSELLLKKGSTVTVESEDTGILAGTVVWNKHRFLSDVRIGIKFQQTTDQLRNFLSKKYCEMV